MSLLLARGLGGPSLFVGSYPTSCPFSCGFTCVVDLTKGASDANPTYRATAISTARASNGQLRYLHVPIEDRASVAKSMLELLRGELLPALLDAWEANARILIHCREGKSRSVTVAAAFLMKLHARDGLFSELDVTREGGLVGATVAFIRRAREVAKPNKGFLRALQQLRLQLEAEPVEASV